MCRLTAYIGPEIPLERIIVLPRHSLLDQSQSANESKLEVNGDGFGLCWYDEHNEKPGLYRDVLPAWSDTNLTSICRMVRAPLFLAHVRASTYGETSRSNCHPFTHGNWSFMHNGQIGGFQKIRRQLEALLPDDLYDAKCGTTDSELFFLLALANGLDTDPWFAFKATISQITQMQMAGAPPVRLTCVCSDGQSLFAFRYSSDNKSPTLYVSQELDSGGISISSEPLDADGENWCSIEESEFVSIVGNIVTRKPFLWPQAESAANSRESCADTV